MSRPLTAEGVWGEWCLLYAPLRMQVETEKVRKLRLAFLRSGSSAGLACEAFFSDRVFL